MNFLQIVDAFKMPDGLVSLELIPYQLNFRIYSNIDEICARIENTMTPYYIHIDEEDKVKKYFENIRKLSPIGTKNVD
jgi:hypothetical protein